MIIQISNPVDTFNLLEVLEFRYISKMGQTSKKTLSVKCKKYRDNGDGTFSYSDDPPFNIFVKDVDQHIAEDLGNNKHRYSSPHYVAICEEV
jgi:hypothetical protein